MSLLFSALYANPLSFRIIYWFICKLLWACAGLEELEHALGDNDPLLIEIGEKFTSVPPCPPVPLGWGPTVCCAALPTPTLISEPQHEIGHS